MYCKQELESNLVSMKAQLLLFIKIPLITLNNQNIVKPYGVSFAYTLRPRYTKYVCGQQYL